MDSQPLSFWAPDLEEGVDRGQLAVQAAKSVRNLPIESYRRDLDLVNVRLYEASPITNLYTYAGRGYGGGSSAHASFNINDSSTWNVAKSAIDTLASQIASTDQRARCLTTGGNYLQRRRARKLQTFCDGLVHELDLHALKQRAFLDAAVLESGVGAIQFYRTQDNKVGAQRVLATELSIDPKDGWIDGKPRTLYRHRAMPRDLVRADFGGKNAYSDRTDDAITNANSVDGSALGDVSDLVEVFETWHLPISKTSHDGYHIVALDHVDGTLLVEEYAKSFHSIVPFSLEDRMTTAWGNSLMSQARPIQTRINIDLYRIERAQKLFSAGHLYVNRASRMEKSKLSNELGAVWEGTGDSPPKALMFPAVPVDYYNHLLMNVSKVFELLGINRGASQGQHDLGLDVSAAAIRESVARADQRNAVRQQRWERFHIACVTVALDLVRDIVETTKGKYSVTSPSKRSMSLVDWADVALDEGEFVLSIQPSSTVPTTAAGLLAYGKEMIDAGAWSPADLAGYMADLDADARSSLENGQHELLEQIFESLLYDKSASEAPDDFTDLDLALKLGVQYLAMGQVDGCPEKHLERLRRYLEQVQARMAKRQPAPPQPAPAQAQAA